jgi:hypothetical protein
MPSTLVARDVPITVTMWLKVLKQLCLPSGSNLKIQDLEEG